MPEKLKNKHWWG